MKEGVIHKYGHDNGNIGLEVSYVLRGHVLKIQIDGSNHWVDYLTNFFAWPRVALAQGKIHAVWGAMALQFVDHLMVEFPNIATLDLRIVGHSMGGAVAALIPAFLPKLNAPPSITVINAPKAGNRAYREWVFWDTAFSALYDKGDVVRHLPLLYAKYWGGCKVASTVPFWKAHNNLPGWWGSFLESEDNEL